MEEESRQKTDRKRMLGLLTVSCAATLCFAGLYVQELKTVEKLESAGQWTDTEELNALRADYSAAISRAELAEQEQEERTQVNDLITAFLNAYFLLPDSREALLSGCEEYVSKDAWRTIELLSDSRDYNEAERELFYYHAIVQSWKMRIANTMHLPFLQLGKSKMEKPMIRAICWRQPWKQTELLPRLLILRR